MALHVLQLGSDATVFRSSPWSDTMSRWRAQTDWLTRTVPGARMTYVVLGADPADQPITDGALSIVPVPGTLGRSYLVVPKTLARLHDGQPISVISTQTVLEDARAALAFAHTRKLPVVGQIHHDLLSGEWTGKGWRGPVNEVRRRMALRSLHRLAAIRVVGANMETSLLARCPDLDVRRIPVAMSMVRETSAQIDTGVGADRTETVLFAQRIAPDKAPEDWLQVAARIRALRPGTRFVVAGDGPDRKMMSERGRELLGRDLTMLGPVPGSDMANVYRSAAVLLLTSRYEGFGRVVAESLASGTPVVAPAVGGISDIVKHGRSGFLHRPGDFDAMADSAVKVLSDPDLRRVMGQYGSDDVRNRYDFDMLTRQWVQMLTDVAQSHLRD